MPLNRQTGELIGDLGPHYQIAPLDRWASTPLYAQAEKHAAEAFFAAGALAPLYFRDDDVLVQEYPSQRKLAFLFQRKIAGKEHFYPYVFDLPDDMVAQLRAIGKWGYRH